MDLLTGITTREEGDIRSTASVPNSRYWISVYLLAAALLHDRPDLSGDEAYALARQSVDESPLELEG